VVAGLEPAKEGPAEQATEEPTVLPRKVAAQLVPNVPEPGARPQSQLPARRNGQDRDVRKRDPSRKMPQGYSALAKAGSGGRARERVAEPARKGRVVLSRRAIVKPAKEMLPGPLGRGPVEPGPPSPDHLLVPRLARAPQLFPPLEVLAAQPAVEVAEEPVREIPAELAEKVPSVPARKPRERALDRLPEGGHLPVADRVRC
jgi:hypothetical protein